MLTRFVEFLRDESGAVTADSVVVLGGLSYMFLALVLDIGSAAVNLADDINDELLYNETLHAILEGRGPGTDEWEDTH